jgi:hypothetical protein
MGGYGGDRCTQYIIPGVGDYNYIYFRAYENGNWCPWSNTFTFKKVLYSTDDANDIKENGIYCYSTASVPKNSPFANAAVIVVFGCNSASSQKIQLAFRYGSPCQGKFRALYDDTWQPWAEFAGLLEDTTYSGCYYRYTNGNKEWDNPPMVDGVEYRTTKRMSGKPVYAIKKNVGTMPDYTNSKSIPIDIGCKMDEVLTFDVYCVNKSNKSYRYKIPYVYTNGGVLATARIERKTSSDYVYIYATSQDTSGYEATVILEYTKE